MAVTMKNAIFLDLTPYGSCEFLLTANVVPSLLILSTLKMEEILRNVSSYKSHMVSYPRRCHSSNYSKLQSHWAYSKGIYH
jgi:hypothetical protein